MKRTVAKDIKLVTRRASTPSLYVCKLRRTNRTKLALLMIFILFQIHTIVQKDGGNFGETIITHQSVCQMIINPDILYFRIVLQCSESFFHTENFQESIGQESLESRFFGHNKRFYGHIGHISTVNEIKGISPLLGPILCNTRNLVSLQSFVKVLH